MDYSSIDAIIYKTKDFLKKDFLVVEKGFADFVTSIDVQIEDFLVLELSKLFKDATFVLEEKEKSFSSNYFVIDPLDGTTNFLRGIYPYGLTLAYVKDQEVVYGAIYDFMNDLLLSSYGNKVYLNGQEYLYQGEKRDLRHALIDLGTSPYQKDSKRLGMMVERLFMKCLDLRRSGSTAINILNVALGKLDAFLEYHLSLWDYLGGAFILKNLGLVSATYLGYPLSLESLNSSFVVASNEKLLKEILEICLDVYVR